MSERAKSFLPLNRRHYLVLVALTGGDRHGYAIKKEIRRITDGVTDPGAGSLYRSIRQLDEAALIAEAPERPDPALDDERRTYYRLTALGREVAELETDRLREFVATTARLVGRKES
jgi:DNA-binding PadR family transcriptional regulator